MIIAGAILESVLYNIIFGRYLEYKKQQNRQPFVKIQPVYCWRYDSKICDCIC